VFVVRNEYANNFTLATANTILNPANYSNIAKTGADISHTLPAGVTDIYGQPIINGVGYRVFVMSVGYGVSYGTNALSAPSAAITLVNTGVVPAVTNVIVSDVSDYNNGQDMFVSFNRAADESNISQYRIFVVKEANAAAFNLATANVTAAYTVAAAPNLGNINMPLTQATLDVNGAPILNNTEYRVFVLSVAKNGISHALSLASNKIMLTSASLLSAPEVPAVQAQQIGTTTDVNVFFTNPGNENGIVNYAVLLVKDSDGVLTQNAANTAYSNGNFTLVGKTGQPQYAVTLSSGSKDTTGAFLSYGPSYKIYVLSIADGTVAHVNKLSTAFAGGIILQAPVV
jgi:hypothetical protein